MRKGEIVPKILEILQAQAEVTASLLDVFFSGYHQSYRKSRKMMLSGPRRFDKDWAFEYRQRQKFYSLLNKLKNEGLVEKKKSQRHKSSIWIITKKGLERLNLLKERARFSKNTADYKRAPDNKIKVIIFDIPEKERHKRDWLRFALVALNFSMLQESVWIGENKIPAEFIQDLRGREMLPYVQIFEISQKGTIYQIS